MPKLRLAWSSAIETVEATSRSTDAAADAVAVGGGGVAPHEAAAEVVFRGVGAPDAKSLVFESVSTQPPPARSDAVVFDNAEAGALPS